ncbi:hypothetical protein D3C78_1588600 [compost metagenome]
MPDAGEEAADVRLQDVAVIAPVALRHPHEVLGPGHCRLSALADPAGVGVVNELPLVQRADSLHQGMMHHAVGEWRRLDEAQFGASHDEFTLPTWRPGLAKQLLLKPCQGFLRPDRETQHVRPLPLAAPRLQIGVVEVFE